MNTENKTCTECGQSLKAHWHSFGNKLATALILFAEKSHGERKRLSEVFTDTSDQTNFQKLRHFGLVLHFPKHAAWQVSAKGYQFLRGDIAIPKKVFTVQNIVERTGNDEVFLKDVLKEEAVWQKEYKPVRLPIRKTEEAKLF